MKTPEEIATAIIETRRPYLPGMSPADEINIRTMIVDGIEADRARRTIEILHQRDPDYSCAITLFADGEEISGATIEDVDPGAGYSREDWDARHELPETYSPAFAAATLEALDAGGESPYIDDKES